jgi:hypothetical protein
VSDRDNFLDLGGNSIAAVQLGARIEQLLGVRVEPAEILLADSLSDLAEHVKATPVGAADLGAAHSGAAVADDAVSTAR